MALLDRRFVAREWPKVVEKLGLSLLSIGAGAERIDDPNLTKVNCGGQCGALGIAWDEFHVLDSAALEVYQRWFQSVGPGGFRSTYIGDRDGTDDCSLG